VSLEIAIDILLAISTGLRYPLRSTKIPQQMRSMRSVPYLAACMALVWFVPAIDVRADASGRMITIRSYNTFSSAPADFATARDVARQAFQQAGLDAGWRECRTARRAEADSCSDVLGSGEVIVRIVAAPAGGADDVLGDAQVDTAQGGGVLATVFADRVHRAAARARSDAAILLGRAVAHEVGHLLIGSSRHSRRGLMRAWWSDSELQRDRDYDWQFSPRQVSRLRAAVAARHHRPQTVVVRPVAASLNP
jgi:hypothetical protein